MSKKKTMVENELKEALYGKYISPTKREKTQLIGIEIEMPVATLDGAPTRHSVCQRAFDALVDRFGFEKRLFDVNGACYSAIRPDNGDDLSFDCSFNNLELSLGCVTDIKEAKERFEAYVCFANQELLKDGHLLTGMGVNPNYRVNDTTYVETGRYGMLGAFLRQCGTWEGEFHPYPSFGTFASASQVQLDVEEDEIASVLKAFSLIEPLKAVLFANSVMDEEPELLCVRDMLWEKSTHGINPRNVGFYDEIPGGSEQLVDYISRASLFCAERGGHYLFFKPIPAFEYFDLPRVEAIMCRLLV